MAPKATVGDKQKSSSINMPLLTPVLTTLGNTVSAVTNLVTVTANVNVTSNSASTSGAANIGNVVTVSNNSSSQTKTVKNQHPMILPMGCSLLMRRRM